MQRRDQRLLGKVKGIGRGQRRQQTALVLQVIEQNDVLLSARGVELPSGQPVADRDRQRQLGRAQGGPRDADPARNQRPQHGEEAAGLALDRTRVGPVRRHRAETVEQGVARYPNLVEPQPSVVDTLEAALIPAILDPDAGAGAAALVADRHQEDVHPPPLPRRDQLGEDGRQPAVARDVADVVLARIVVRGVDGEFFARRVVGRGGPDGLHVGAVPGFGHGEAARQLHRHGGAQISLMMSLGPEPPDYPAEEPELHADLDQQR